MARTIESISEHFRGYTERRSIASQHVVEAIADILDLALLRNVASTSVIPSNSRSFDSNESFWRLALDNRMYEGLKVTLKNFHVMEWLPSSPGRYFTKEAEYARLEAEEYYMRERGEYLPLGKSGMILGGVGCVRLKSRQLDNNLWYFLGASSNGISHQGILLILRSHEYMQMIDPIKERGGCVATISGVIRVLPNDLSIIQYSEHTPKYCLVVDEVTLEEDANPHKL